MFYLDQKIIEKYNGFYTKEFVSTGLLEKTDKIILVSDKWYKPNKTIKFPCVTRNTDSDLFSYYHSDSFIEAIKFLNKCYQPEYCF